MNKYDYHTILQGNYGYGWGDECYCEDSNDAKTQLKTYRENCPNASFRIIHRRELKKQNA